MVFLLKFVIPELNSLSNKKGPVAIYRHRPQVREEKMLS